MTTRRTPHDRGHGRRGQGLVEFAILIPAFMVVLFGMLEFGIAFSHHMTLEYATREGARVGAALGNGTLVVPCDPSEPEDVDELVIAAVQRVLTSPGSQIPPADVKEIHIYKANATGGETAGAVNVWVPGSGGETVDGTPLVFRPSSQPWDICTRKKFLTTTDPDSMGVSLIYDYTAITPLGTLLNMGGLAPLRITDRTIMALEPFQDG